MVDERRVFFVRKVFGNWHRGFWDDRGSWKERLDT